MAGSVTTTTSVGVPVTGEEEEAAMAAVRDMLGPNQKVVSVEKKVVVREEEVIMILKISFIPFSYLFLCRFFLSMVLQLLSRVKRVLQ